MHFAYEGTRSERRQPRFFIAWPGAFRLTEGITAFVKRDMYTIYKVRVRLLKPFGLELSPLILVWASQAGNISQCALA